MIIIGRDKMKTTTCANCGMDERDHAGGKKHNIGEDGCIFIPINAPAGCVCYSLEWNNPEKIPAVCKKFSNIKNGKICDKCEHDEECHEQN